MRAAGDTVLHSINELLLVPGERIRHTDKFGDPNPAGTIQTTVSLKKVSVGTELTVVQEGISK